MSTLESTNEVSRARAVDASSPAVEPPSKKMTTLYSGEDSAQWYKKRADDFVQSIFGEYKPIPDIKISDIEAFLNDELIQDGEEIPKSKVMLVLHDVVSLETGLKSNIVIRSITRPFWKVCMEIVDKPDERIRVCAVGTPGIGKTTSTPILIRMLLKRRHTVVYHIRMNNQSGWYYEFSPDKESDTLLVSTNVYPEDTKYYNIASLRNSSTYYVVDPGITTEQPKSALIGYQISETDKGNFFEHEIVVISDHVANIIYMKHIKKLWSTMLDPVFKN
jgi:hypothetical protein